VSNGHDRNGRPNPPEDVTMTHEQRQLVRQSLARLREDADPLSLLLYGKLFELDPSTRRLFHNDLVAQGRKLMATLDAIANSLDSFESMRPRLIELGRLHASYGIRPAHYDTLVNAVLWAFAQALGPDFDTPTREAWRLALARVGAVMQEGAAAQQ
jgi:hemoglobin-like flavoprotein